MKWLAIHIDTSPAGLEPVSSMLEDLGIEGLVIEDEGDFRDFLEHNRQYWDYVDEELDRSMAGKCRVTFYVEDGRPGLYHRGSSPDRHGGPEKGAPRVRPPHYDHRRH